MRGFLAKNCRHRHCAQIELQCIANAHCHTESVSLDAKHYEVQTWVYRLKVPVMDIQYFLS